MKLFILWTAVFAIVVSAAEPKYYHSHSHTPHSHAPHSYIPPTFQQHSHTFDYTTPQATNGQNNLGNGIVCTTDCRRCKKNNTEVVCRDNECKFKPCSANSKEDWEKPEGNKTNFKNTLEEYQTTNPGDNGQYQDWLLKNDGFKSMNKTSRKTLKKGLFRELRGKKITVNRTSAEKALDYDKGGVKIMKRFKLLPDFDGLGDFKMIDMPEREDDAVEIGNEESFLFEDEAEFKWKHKNFSAATTKKTEAEGYHLTTFKDKDTNEECTIDGANAESCKIGKTKFEMLFAGSVGAGAVTIEQCLSQDSPNVVTVVDGNYVFNGVPYVDGTKIGLTLGIYIFKDIPEGHPFNLFPDSDEQFARVLSCNNDTNGDTALPCTGDLTLHIIEAFNTFSYECTTHGPMGGTQRMYYDTDCPVASASDDDESNAALVGGIVAGVIVLGIILGYFLYVKGYISIGYRYNPVVNAVFSDTFEDGC